MPQFISLVAVGYLAVVGALYVFQRNLLYLPDNSRPSPSASGAGEMEAVTLTTSDGLELTSWYKASAKGKPTIIYFHGNAGNIGGRAGKVKPYIEQGYGVLLTGYRGYGGNPGKPSEEGLYKDGRAAVEFASSQGINPSLMVLYGESLGTGVAIQIAMEMASTAPVGAVVLEAPYTSISDVAAYHYPYVPVRYMIRDRFESISKIASISSPLLVFHGDRDRTIPIRFGRKLFAAAMEPKKSHWYAGAGHTDLYDFGAAKTVLDFLK